MSNRQYIMKNGKAVEVSEELYKYLKKSDRKIEYYEKDLKREDYIINQEKCTVKEIPSREDSLDRLMEFGKDFSDNRADFQESSIAGIMVEQAISKLSDEERYLITQIYYLGRTERDLARELHKTQQNINKSKHRILCKLYEILKE